MQYSCTESLKFIQYSCTQFVNYVKCNHWRNGMGWEPVRLEHKAKCRQSVRCTSHFCVVSLRAEQNTVELPYCCTHVYRPYCKVLRCVDSGTHECTWSYIHTRARRNRMAFATKERVVNPTSYATCSAVLPSSPHFCYFDDTITNDCAWLRLGHQQVTNIRLTW